MKKKPRRIYNAEQSRQDILQSAEQQFAEKGFYGARVQVIADNANINKRMIYEYYTNKDLLYQAVLESVYKRMADAEQEVIDKAFTGIRLITEIVSMYFEFLEENPGFVSILLWENLNRASHIKKLAGTITRPTSNVLARELELGQKSGLFRKDLDVKQTVISLITMTFANFSNRHTLSQLFDVDLTSPEAVKIRKQHTTDIILAYVCVDFHNLTEDEVDTESVLQDSVQALT